MMEDDHRKLSPDSFTDGGIASMNTVIKSDLDSG